MPNADLLNRLRERLARVKARIAAACARAGRPRAEVTLVAVTKAIRPELAALLPGLGVHDLGENRPQELWRKAEALPAGVRWHMIGHLQRNKLERTLPLVAHVHSIDSQRLLLAAEAEAARQCRTVPCLIEVNVSGEASKQGLSPRDALGLIPAIQTLRHVRVEGLMTLAPLQVAEACRPTFRALRQLRDQLREHLAAPHLLQHLSMGMSNDYEVAIEEGATFVRLGSVLFEGLE